MSRNFDQVLEFHKKFNCAINVGIPTVSGDAKTFLNSAVGSVESLHLTSILINDNLYSGRSLNLLRITLLLEEVTEYLKAELCGSREKIADSLGDIGVIIDGTAISYGINLPLVRDEIHRSNMSKLGSDGNPITRSDGKILKGPNYSPPNLYGIVARGLIQHL